MNVAVVVDDVIQEYDTAMLSRAIVAGRRMKESWGQYIEEDVFFGATMQTHQGGQTSMSSHSNA